MKKTLEIIVEMHRQGVFRAYAIGGGMASLFYIEPIATFDLDIFVLLEKQEGPLVSLSPIYEWLKSRGYALHKEQVMIEGIPVQFIPAYNDLVQEAIADPLEKAYEDLKVKVLRPEHLMALQLQTNRPKDRERTTLFLEEAEFSEDRLREIFVRHGLWERFLALKGER